MRRLIPFLLRTKRRLRRTKPRAVTPPASEPPAGRPFQARKDRDNEHGLRLLKPDRT